MIRHGAICRGDSRKGAKSQSSWGADFFIRPVESVLCGLAPLREASLVLGSVINSVAGVLASNQVQWNRVKRISSTAFACAELML